jgi:membrane protease YdiL (CAAX protease family)
MEDTTGDRPMSPLAAALWTIALFLLELTCLQATEAVRPGAQNDFVNVGACAALATSALIFAMVRVHARDASLRAILGIRAPAPLHVPLAAAVGAGLFPLLSTIDDLIIRRWPDATNEEAIAKVLGGLVSYPSRVALVVAMCIVVPIARELFFRGILFGEVKRATNTRVAIVSTAVFFMSFWPDSRLMPTRFGLGLALAVLRERTGTVVTAVVAHLAFEAVEGIPILRGTDPAATVTYSTRWIVGGAVIALLALVAAGAGRRDES